MSVTLVTPTEAELELRKLRSAIIKELRDQIRLKARDQILLRQSIKEKARACDYCGSLQSQRLLNRSEISAALTLYAEIRGKKSSHKMNWYGDMILTKLIKGFGEENIAKLKAYSAK